MLRIKQVMHERREEGVVADDGEETREVLEKANNGMRLKARTRKKTRERIL